MLEAIQYLQHCTCRPCCRQIYKGRLSTFHCTCTLKRAFGQDLTQAGHSCMSCRGGRCKGCCGRLRVRRHIRIASCSSRNWWVARPSSSKTGPAAADPGSTEPQDDEAADEHSGSGRRRRIHGRPCRLIQDFDIQAGKGGVLGRDRPVHDM